ncbi:MAG TPA: anthranilate phosphoribosyltransferase [Gammaproteobacteria bacterium]|nr:anthranilate phosphoribosyltransferase [Gammaproteobacteria bacterium]
MNETEQLLQQPPKTIMRSIIQRIATGPDMSKDISREEARAGMSAILNGDIDPVQSAIFLIALRMKRETDDENRGILDAIRDHTLSVTADVDEVLDVSDPYNGYNRTLPAAPFLPAVMAACGVATVSHGVETMSPKFGITHHRVLKAAGKDISLSTQQAADQLGGDAGWAYVDQKAWCPPLHDLTDLRSNIVKRQAITTVEVLAGPVRGRSKTHYMSGYVHKPYTRVYAMLARHSGFDSCLMIRGVEGGITPSLRQSGKVFYYHDRGEEQGQDFNPADIGIEQDVRATPLPDELPPAPESEDVSAEFDAEAVAKMAADAGLAALNGETGSTRDALVYSAAIALWHLKKADDLQAGADMAREVLDNGSALQRFNAAK